jgi:hypothetical protein
MGISDDFFTYLPLFAILFTFLIFLNKALEKKALIKAAYKEVKKRSNLDEYEKVTLKRNNFTPIIINLLFVGYNLKMFFNDFSNIEEVFFNFWVSFFLLLLNIPLFIYKDGNEKGAKNVAIIMLLCISIFSFPVLLFNQSSSIITLFVGWLVNYTSYVFNNEERKLDNLKGKTVFFILFWILIILLSMVIKRNFLLPEKYNYGYVINAFYFLMYAYINYILNKYQNIKTNIK